MRTKKKIALILLSFLLFSMYVFAAEIVPISAKPEGNYTSISGKITSIEEKDGTLSILVGDRESGIIFNLYNDVTVLHEKDGEKETADLKKDQFVTVIYPKNSPMTLSLPGISSSAEVILIRTNEKDFCDVSLYNSELTNAENTLLINPSDDTVIRDLDYKEVKKDNLSDKELVVLYSASTKSIPAQTTPSFVLALESEVLSDSYIEGGVRMVALRKMAETNEFKVTWNQETKTVTLTKGAFSATVTIGQEIMGINKSILKASVAPTIVERSLPL